MINSLDSHIMPIDIYYKTLGIIVWIKYLTGVKIEWKWDSKRQWVVLLLEGKDSWSVSADNLNNYLLGDIVLMFIATRIDRID